MMGSRSLSNFSEAICHLNDKTIISGNDLGKITVQKIGSEKADWERLLNGSALEISHCNHSKSIFSLEQTRVMFIFWIRLQERLLLPTVIIKPLFPALLSIRMKKILFPVGWMVR